MEERFAVGLDQDINIIVEAQCQKTQKNQHCTHALD